MAVTRSTPATWQYLGFNVANDINFGSGAAFSQSNIDADAQFLYDQGIQYFRGNANSGSSGISQTYVRAVMKAHHDLGATVQYGLAFTPSLANQAQIEADIATEAAYSEAQGFERFQIGNETMINTGGLSLADTYTYLQTLPAIARSAGFTGIITTSEAQDNYSQWTSNGIGNYDELGLDIYGNGTTIGYSTFPHFKAQIDSFKATFGSDAFISEWNVSPSSLDPYVLDSELWCLNMRQRLAYLKTQFTVPCYTHCWRFNGTDVLDLWSARQDSGDLHPFYYAIMEKRKGVYE